MKKKELSKSDNTDSKSNQVKKYPILLGENNGGSFSGYETTIELKEIPGIIKKAKLGSEEYFSVNLTPLFEYFDENTSYDEEKRSFNIPDPDLADIFRETILAMNLNHKKSGIHFNYFIDSYLELFFSIRNFKKLEAILSVSTWTIQKYYQHNPTLKLKNSNDPEDKFYWMLHFLETGLKELNGGGIPKFHYDLEIIDYYSFIVLEPKEAKSYLIELIKSIQFTNEEQDYKDYFCNSIDTLLSKIDTIERYKPTEESKLLFFEKKGNKYNRLKFAKPIDIAYSLFVIQTHKSQKIVTDMENSKSFQGINFESLKSTIKKTEKGNRIENKKLTEELRFILKDIGIIE